jgi:hypothetical protein
VASICTSFRHIISYIIFGLIALGCLYLAFGGKKPEQQPEKEKEKGGKKGKKD